MFRLKLHGNHVCNMINLAFSLDYLNLTNSSLNSTAARHLWQVNRHEFGQQDWMRYFHAANFTFKPDDVGYKGKFHTDQDNLQNTQSR